jgi:hypothetical protein
MKVTSDRSENILAAVAPLATDTITIKESKEKK